MHQSMHYIHQQRKATTDSKQTLFPVQSKGAHHLILSSETRQSRRDIHVQYPSSHGPNTRTSEHSTKSASTHCNPPHGIRRSSGLLRRRTIWQKGFSQRLNPAAWARALRISVYNSRYRSMRIPVLFESAHVTAEREVLIDSGATDNFISKNLLHRLKIGYLPVETPIKIWNVDGTHNQDGAISHFTDLQVRTGNETKTLRFLITNLGRDEVILGYPWLTAFKPIVHWKDATLDKKCQPVIISSLKPEEVQVATTITEEEWEDLTGKSEGEPYTIIRKTTTASELAQKAMDKTKRTFEQMVPEEYRRHARTFNEKESHRFPPPRPWDHAIELLPDAPKAFDCKIYPMARGEEESLREFIDEQLQKGYIRPSKSPYASPFFFIKKKDGKLRPVQDYRKLNSLTVKNQYPLPLIPELIDLLRNTTLFTKLDIRWGYNNIRIKEGDQEKGAFKTNLGLYNPCVMFFGLTNSPSTFQTMMDMIFRDLTTTGEVVIYMDDILIATPTDLPHHRRLVHRVLDKLEEHNLYLKPEKCTFEALEVEYLGLIIGHGRVCMDHVKVQGVDGWKHPKNLTEL